MHTVAKKLVLWEFLYYNVFNVVLNVVNMEVLVMQVNELLSLAIKETENLYAGEVFLVKDLFKGYLWNRIPLKDRLLLGTLFLNNISNHTLKITAIEKTSSNQQKYRKD